MRKSSHRQGPMLAALMAVLTLAGCAQLEIADRAVAYNKAVEDASNRILVLNIIRANKRYPRHFTDFTQLSGNVPLSGTFALQIPFGGDASNTFPLTPRLELSQTSSPSFDVAILDSKEFTSGILSPIEKKLFEFYWHQRWPPEVLLHLFIHKVDITIDPWAASKRYPKGTTILENGLVWKSSGGKSAGEPKWGKKPGNTVVDADINLEGALQG